MEELENKLQNPKNKKLVTELILTNTVLLNTLSVTLKINRCKMNKTIRVTYY